MDSDDFIDPQGHIIVLFEKVYGPVQEIKLDHHIGLRRHEIGNGRSDEGKAKRRWRGDPEPSRRRGVWLLEASVGFCKFREKAAHPCEIERTRFRKLPHAGLTA